MVGRAAPHVPLNGVAAQSHWCSEPVNVVQSRWCRADARVLCRVRVADGPAVLQVKMQSVGGSYDARLGRVISARGLLEGQIQQQLVLLDGYSRIASMIEIEVEMNTSVRPDQRPPSMCLLNRGKLSALRLLCT